MLRRTSRACQQDCSTIKALNDGELMPVQLGLDKLRRTVS